MHLYQNKAMILERKCMVRHGRIRYDLQLFAKDGEGGEKTESATPKKLEDARKKRSSGEKHGCHNGCVVAGVFLFVKAIDGIFGQPI